jgi:hypothetical protein
MVAIRSLVAIVLAHGSTHGDAYQTADAVDQLHESAHKKIGASLAVTDAGRSSYVLGQSRELLSFEEACSAQESTFEGVGYTCECASSTRTVTCSRVASSYTNEMTTVFNEEGRLQWVYTCTQYTGYPPFCMNTTSAGDSCSVQDTSGVMSECRTCEYCEDVIENGLNVDCSNVYPDSIPTGCDRSALDFGPENVFGSAGGSGGNGGGIDSPPESSGIFHATASLGVLAGIVVTLLP